MGNPDLDFMLISQTKRYVCVVFYAFDLFDHSAVINICEITGIYT